MPFRGYYEMIGSESSNLHSCYSSRMERGLCGEGKEGKNSGGSEVGEHLDKCELCNGHQIRSSGDEIVERRVKSIYI